jgi:hypothetical protein
VSTQQAITSEIVATNAHAQIPRMTKYSPETANGPLADVLSPAAQRSVN